MKRSTRHAATVASFDASQAPAARRVCRALRAEIERALPDATSKVWHGAPVWFVGETPVAGYDVAAKGDVVLLFWNGRAFGDPALRPIGKFQAAEARFADLAELERAPVRRWLKAARSKLWDVGEVRRLREAARRTATDRTSHAGSGTAKAEKDRVRAPETAAARLIDQRIRELGGWRGETLARMRALILGSDREIVEDVKWRGTPVWSRDGIVCTGEAYAKVVKLTFAKGAELDDPARLFNASLEGSARRAIDIREGQAIDASAFQALVKAAIVRNAPSAARGKPGGRETQPVRLLSGGNPQIAKADGDAPVQAYIAAMPGWKRDLGRRLDALVVHGVPEVRKAVKWNSPFYGLEGQGWFLSFHTFTRYVKLAFFRGTELRPPPPGASKVEGTRYLDIHEHDVLDEARISSWVKQAAALPGWVP